MDSLPTEPRILAGRYRVDEVIGTGGMATVHRGFDLTLGRDVAIKILDPELARDPVFRNRFRLEAQSASRMSHPSIVRVFDAGDPSAPGSSEGQAGEETEPYIIMELVQGTLLKDIIAEGPVSVSDAVRYVDGILEALDYSHRAGVVHRDIKPGNVMVTAAGQVKVMDFGIARAVSDSSSTVAETTQIIGTAAYFSPEQAKGEPVDARADLYSTGVVLFELLTVGNRSAETPPLRSLTSTSAKRRCLPPRSTRRSRARWMPSCCRLWRRTPTSASRMPHRSALRCVRRHRVPSPAESRSVR